MPWWGAGLVWGWFKCITFIVHFFCHLIPALIWQEVLVCGPEVGDLWIIESLERLVKWPVGKTYKNNFGENAGQIPEPFYLYHSQETGASHHTRTKNHMFFAGFCISKTDVPCLTLPPHTLIAHTHKVKVLAAQLCWLFTAPQTRVHQAPLSVEFSRKNTGVGTHSLLQGIFPIQGSNPGLLHCRWILYCQSHQGSPLIANQMS